MWLQAAVALPLDYEVSFELTPDAVKVEDWSSIVHFTATGENCCAYGDRVPGENTMSTSNPQLF